MQNTSTASSSRKFKTPSPAAAPPFIFAVRFTLVNRPLTFSLQLELEQARTCARPPAQSRSRLPAPLCESRARSLSLRLRASQPRRRAPAFPPILSLFLFPFAKIFYRQNLWSRSEARPQDRSCQADKQRKEDQRRGVHHNRSKLVDHWATFTVGLFTTRTFPGTSFPSPSGIMFDARLCQNPTFVGLNMSRM